MQAEFLLATEPKKPNPKEVKKWLSEINEPFQMGLAAFARSLNDPEEYGWQNKMFTGIGLCRDASFVLKNLLQERFNDPNFYAVYSMPVRADGKVMQYHTWLRFAGSDREDYFIDPTYGQIDLQANRIIMELTDLERYLLKPQYEPVITDHKASVYAISLYDQFFGHINR